MEIQDGTPVINLCNVSVGPAVLAAIATYLETCGRVYVCNAARPIHGPGRAALMLGMRVKEVEGFPQVEDLLKKDGE
jgi:hypothetical protein